MAFDINDWENAVTAANYIGETDEGFIVGNMEETLKGNVLITADPAIFLRNGEAVLAEFSGKFSDFSAVVKLLENVEIGTYKTGASSASSYINAPSGIVLSPSKPGVSGWSMYPHAVIDESGFRVGGDGSSSTVYDLVRRELETDHNDSCTVASLQAYTMGGICFVSGVVHNNSAGTGMTLIALKGVNCKEGTQFPVSCYGGYGEGWTSNSGTTTNLTFDLPSAQDWRFNFTFAIS